MRWSFRSLGPLALVVAACALSGCEASSAPGSVGPTPAPHDAGGAVAAAGSGITLRTLPSTQEGEVIVEAVLDVASPSGRVMELQIKHPPELRYVSSTKGAALDAAEKDLVVQEKAPDVLRTLAFSGANVNTIGDGVLVQYRFTATGAGPYRLEVATDKPIFAPPAANSGLLVGDPIDVRP